MVYIFRLNASGVMLVDGIDSLAATGLRYRLSDIE